MDEFRTPVEITGVVFIGFHHKKRRVAQARGLTEVQWRAANEITRLEPGLVQNPRQHAGGGGFAVGAGHGQYPAVTQHGFAQPLRPGGIGEAFLEDVFHRFMAPWQAGVADHDEIRRRIQLRRLETFEYRDARGCELVAHGRIDGFVTATDVEPELLSQLRQAAHERAADAEKIDMLFQDMAVCVMATEKITTNRAMAMPKPMWIFNAR